MTEQPVRHLNSPVLPAMLMGIYAVLLGYLKSGVLILLLPFVVLPLLVLSARSLIHAFRDGRRGQCYVTLALVLASPLLTYVTLQVRDDVRFLIWAPFIAICLHKARIPTASLPNGTSGAASARSMIPIWCAMKVISSGLLRTQTFGGAASNFLVR